MKIIYGVDGQGFGHCMRSRVVIKHLVDQGHEVKVLAYGQALPVLSPDFDTTEIYGLHLVYKHNRICYFPTIWINLKRIKQAWASWKLVKKIFTEFQPQIVFSDYEPLSSIYGHKFKVPVISLGNHYFITRTEIKYENKMSLDYLAVKFVNKLMTPYVDKYLVLTIADEKVIAPNTELFPPIVDPSILSLTSQVGDYVLVYLTSAVTEMLEVFKKFPDQKFYIYGFNRDEVIGNITLKSFSRQGFLNDMAGARAMIANAGFSAISEALYLCKPYLALPVAGQFEQILNAIYIEHLGVGKNVAKLDESALKDFLNNIDKYQQTLNARPVENNDRVLKRVDEIVSDE